MLVDVTTHPLLSGKAKALLEADPAAFESQVDLAETLLVLPDVLPTGEGTVGKLRLGVAIQVNFQIEQGLDPFILQSSSSSHTRNSAVYRNRSVDPRAAAAVLSALGTLSLEDRYTARLRSFRYEGRRR